jgi:hypothetical protein
VFITADEKQEAVGIKQRAHDMYSLKSSSASSKPDAMWTMPLALPDWLAPPQY